MQYIKPRTIIKEYAAEFVTFNMSIVLTGQNLLKFGAGRFV